MESIEKTAGGNDAPSPCQSFANAIGVALGDLLLLAGQTDELGECLRRIHTTAYASILSADLRARKGGRRRLPERTALPDAALAVVRAWQAGELNALILAIAELRDALRAHGYAAPSDEG